MFFINLLFIFLGWIVSSFIILNILIILFFGIPITKKLEEKKLLKENNIIKGYRMVMTILSMIYIAISISIFYFLSINTLIAFMAGSVFSLFIARKKLGKNKDNINDYINVNKDYFISENIEEEIDKIKM